MEYFIGESIIGMWKIIIILPHLTLSRCDPLQLASGGLRIHLALGGTAFDALLSPFDHSILSYQILPVSSELI